MSPRVSAASVSLRLAGLNKLADFAGLPRPGDSVGVAETMRGIRRRLSTAPAARKRALDLAGLRACLDAAGQVSFTDARDRAALLMRARTSMSARTLAALRWADVELSDAQVLVSLPPSAGSRRGRQVLVRARKDAAVCLVDALVVLRSVSPDSVFVFPRPDGRQLTGQALFTSSGNAGRDVGGWAGLPKASEAGLRRAVAAWTGPGGRSARLRAARDSALLLVGFFTALRRSNLHALTWGDLVDHGPDGFEVKVRRSKTDQEGAGRSLWVPQAPAGSGSLCPASALRAWRSRLSAELGRAPAAREPVFVSLAPGRAGQMRALSVVGINEVVQRLTQAAGLADTTEAGTYAFGAHSLRAGFVTEGLRGDKLSVAEVAEVTGHKSVDVLLAYRREVNAATANASRKLLGVLSDHTG